MRKLIKLEKMVPILCSDKKNVGKISFVVTKRTKKMSLTNIQHVKANTAPDKGKQRFYLRLFPWDRQTEFNSAETKWGGF